MRKAYETEKKETALVLPSDGESTVTQSERAIFYGDMG
jgi:hypothetical protein